MGAELDPWIFKCGIIRVMLMTPGIGGQTDLSNSKCQAAVGGKWEGMESLSRADLSLLTQKPLRMSVP